VLFEGLAGTPSPAWPGIGPHPDDVAEWIGDEAIASGDEVLAGTCDFVLELAPGRYRIAVARGIEHDVVEREVVIARDAMAELAVELPRVVETPGVSCFDLHVHAAPSFDSDVPLEQRVIGALADGLDGFVASDHDQRADWSAALAAADPRGRLALIEGTELTTDTWGWGDVPAGHFNVFPLPSGVPVDDLRPTMGDIGAVMALVRDRAPGALVQMNHPRDNFWTGYFASIGFDPATGNGMRGMPWLGFDAIEVWNGHLLDAAMHSEIETLVGDWLALLDLGVRVVATANSDTHRVSRSPMGSPRTCIRVDDPHDEPAVIAALAGGRSFGTSGIIVDLQVSGVRPGDTLAAAGPADVRLDVHAAPWVSASSVRIYVGHDIALDEPIDALPFTLERTLTVPAGSWIFAWAEGTDPVPWPVSTAGKPHRSVAFTNPVWAP
jgi:hypothetical protein